MPIKDDDHLNPITIMLKAHCDYYAKRHRGKKHCQRHNGPRILSPKLEVSLKAETNANSNLAL